jgi:uncharacterized protein (TIGR03437 family)
VVADKDKDRVPVTTGGQSCVVTYAGTSPGSTGGLAQIHTVVLATIGQAVSITIAGGTPQTARQSQTGVRLAVT